MEAPQQASTSGWDTPCDRTSHDDPLLECLVLATKMLHRPVSADALIAGLPLVDNKLTPMLFIRAASRAGLHARIVRRRLGRITDLLLPAILLLEDGQACVLDKIMADKTVRIVQPESGAGTADLPIDQLARHYTGYAIFIRPTYEFDARTKDSVIPRSRHWFWDTIKKSWAIYSEIVLASVLINFFALASPLFIMSVYDRVVPNNALETLWVLAVGVIIVFCFDLLIRTLRGYFIDIAGKRTDIMLSATLFERVMGAKLSARPSSVGAFANNLQEFDLFRDFLMSSTLAALVDLPFALLFVAIIWMIGGDLAWVALGTLPLALLAGVTIQIPLGKTIQDLFRYSSQKHAALVESLVGLETIKSMGAESPRQRRWEQAVGHIAKLGLRARLLASSATNITTFVQQMATVLVVLVGVYMIGDGRLTVGALVACTILTSRALAPLTQVAATLTRYHQARTSLHTIDALMKLPQERSADKAFVHRVDFAGEIEFANIDFRYPEQPVDALRGLSFRIGAGERVAIIGRVGSGKSTIQKLLLGLYEPSSGSLLIDGTDSHQLNPAVLRRNIGYVPQDILLFYGSIKDNIALGSPYASDTAVLSAAKLAGVSEFTDRHPLGLDRQVGERGEALSGGQRQSIAVARALIDNPPILLMDEPTNAMDNNSEELLKSRLAEWLDNKTFVLVTHRASLLTLVHRVIVIEAGRVVADGPKESVVEALQQGRIKVKTGAERD